MSKLAISTLLVVSAAGCAVDAGDDPVYTRTIVRTADDGSPSITTESIAAWQQEAEHARAVEQLAAVQAGAPVPYLVSTDSCGDWNATKFFDQTGYTGNELCVIGSGYQYLDYFCRFRLPRSPFTCLSNWSRATRSLWTGQAQLWIESDPGTGEYCQEVVPRYEAEATVSSCVQLGDEFSITP
jgi:hypothetical protein